MAGRRSPDQKPIAFVQLPKVKDPDVQRALEALKTAVLDLQAKGLGPIDVVGSRSGGAALDSLLEALATLGIISDSTVP